jgi:alkanesulfonate monooxygenase SsuD/methylene tetrahydromethanopterin reductase-like flavin-dependent oxidoreductase (luciferase family)
MIGPLRRLTIMVEIGAMYMGGSFSPKSFAIAVESAGFDSVWCGDHMLHYIDGIATLGCYAGCTERITIGTNVIVAPFRPAVVAAKGLITAAATAARRTIIGVGVGGEFPLEFQATGADMHVRGAYTDEALVVMQRLWSGQEVSFRGHWTQFEGFRMEPVVSPPPEVWVGGRSEAALRRALRHASGYAPYLMSPEQLRGRVERLRKMAVENGRSLEHFTIACTLFFVPGRSVEEALATASAGTTALGGLTPERMRSYYLLGDDEACIARLQQYIDAGAAHLILGCAPGHTRQLEEFIAASRRLLAMIRMQEPGKAPRPGNRN